MQRTVGDLREDALPPVETLRSLLAIRLRRAGALTVDGPPRERPAIRLCPGDRALRPGGAGQQRHSTRPAPRSACAWSIWNRPPRRPSSRW
ncbi:hypothetical protein ACRAWF_38635 [Streptomyces sp. L7]